MTGWSPISQIQSAVVAERREIISWNNRLPLSARDSISHSKHLHRLYMNIFHYCFSYFTYSVRNWGRCDESPLSRSPLYRRPAVSRSLSVIPILCALMLFPIIFFSVKYSLVGLLTRKLMLFVKYSVGTFVCAFCWAARPSWLECFSVQLSDLLGTIHK